MNTSFYNGISGTKTQQFGIDTWGDNISNINTIGFKGSTPEFSTVFATAMTDNYFDMSSNDIGLGSRPSTTALDMSQGIFENTDREFDLALAGEGWFGIKNTSDQTLFTRAGAFYVDADGNMVTSGGNYLLGTQGENITPTTLSQEIMDEIGNYYGKDMSEPVEVYAVTEIDDIPLGSVDNQSKINLPDILYYPPTPTTEVAYQGNLNPEVTIGTTNIDVNEADIISTIDALNETITINGTISNTPEALTPIKGDFVLVTVSDITGKEIFINTTLNSNLEWSILNHNIDELDIENEILTTAKLTTNQEIPNVEHFSTNIISPEGKKDILDSTYTKRVPQTDEGSVWDAKIQILTFYETLDDSKTYDPDVYKVDENAKKVYEIIDSQSAVLKFQGSGALLSSDMPTMINGEAELIIDVGEPDSFSGFVSNTYLDNATSVQKNGKESGMLKEYAMDGQGNVVAEFDNGESVPIAKVAVYHFANDQGLSNVSATFFSASSNSGNPIFYTDDNGNNVLGTSIQSQKLEGSNVKYSTALTELMIMQKAFDASAKSITTSDEMIKNAINMKR